ncbi:MAG: Rid family detoxifying hydrolase [Gudongella sp.]|jgi:2-iminobutanoate/2-iminopropanoate deaminase|nr:Rid family detoxifying hydrolase [Gudongella sp.]
MKIEFLSTDKAPGAVGPYSQGTKAGQFIFTSGQLPIDPVTGEMVSDDIKLATKVTLENVKAVLEAAGAGIEDIVKVTVYVTDIKDFDSINEVYAEFFAGHKPARSLLEVVNTAKYGIIEIEAIAIAK